MKLLPALLLIFALPGCASKAMSIEEGRAKEPLPTSEEVIAYVRANWATDYGKRYANFANRPGESAELAEISNVVCDYYVVTPECSFDAIARFSDGEPHRRAMYEQFGWSDEGQLKAVLVIYHLRRP